MNKLLIIVDMQKDFIDGSLGTKEAVQILPKVCEKFEDAMQQENTRICFTLDTHQKDYLNTQEGRNLPVEHCIQNTEGWYLHSELEQKLTKLTKVESLDEFYHTLGQWNTKIAVFPKEVFGSVRLAEFVKDEYEKNQDMEVELVGLCTDICVVSNAILLKSFLPQIRISVDASCCAGVTPQSHQMALETMKMCQINIED